MSTTDLLWHYDRMHKPFLLVVVSIGDVWTMVAWLTFWLGGKKNSGIVSTVANLWGDRGHIMIRLILVGSVKLFKANVTSVGWMPRPRSYTLYETLIHIPPSIRCTNTKNEPSYLCTACCLRDSCTYRSFHQSCTVDCWDNWQSHKLGERERGRERES